MKLSIQSNRKASDRDRKRAAEQLERGPRRGRSPVAQSPYKCLFGTGNKRVILMKHFLLNGIVTYDEAECMCPGCIAFRKRPKPELAGRSKRTRKRFLRWLNDPHERWLEVQREG